jgi:aspartyl/asparaginyl beta-hydroxylase (cupin superfamily)
MPFVKSFFSFLLPPKWVPWPEDHFSTSNDYNSKDWTVFPLCYTFPAFEEKRRTWVQSTCTRCPRTVSLLNTLPNLRTALFSKLGPGTKLSNHTGWADLANYVLRTHLCLTLPKDGYCGCIVDGEVKAI